MADIRPDCIGLTDSFDFPDNLLASTIGRYDGNVYESLVNAARRNPVNLKDPFPGYEEYLKPHLDQKFLSHHNKMVAKM
jgi:acyl-CoA oxidase